MKLDQTTAELIIDDFYDSGTLKEVLSNHGVASKDFYGLVNEIPLLATKFAHAREAKADKFADEVVAIADTEENAIKARNMIDARKWAASKLKPNVYGDRIDLNVNQTIDLVGALKDAKERTAQVIDMTPKLVGTSTGLKTCDDTDIETEDPSNDFAKLLE